MKLYLHYGLGGLRNHNIQFNIGVVVDGSKN